MAKEILQSHDSRYLGRTSDEDLTLNNHGIRNFSATLYEYSGVGFTLEMEHNGCIIISWGSVANQVVIGSDLMPGFQCTVVQMGSGATTLLAGSGVNLRQRSSVLSIAGRYGGAAITVLTHDHVLGNEVWIAGDLA
jgi:hypothetical protein